MSGAAGFAAIPIWLLADGVIEGNEIAIYAALVSFADSHGECYPSVKELALRSGLSRATVFRTLDSLREKKIISWRQRYDDEGQTSNLYRIDVVYKPKSRRSVGLTQTPPPSLSETRTRSNELDKNLVGSPTPKGSPSRGKIKSGADAKTRNPKPSYTSEVVDL